MGVSNLRHRTKIHQLKQLSFLDFGKIAWDSPSPRICSKSWVSTKSLFPNYIILHSKGRFWLWQVFQQHFEIQSLACGHFWRSNSQWHPLWQYHWSTIPHHHLLRTLVFFMCANLLWSSKVAFLYGIKWSFAPAFNDGNPYHGYIPNNRETNGSLDPYHSWEAKRIHPQPPLQGNIVGLMNLQP